MKTLDEYVVGSVEEFGNYAMTREEVLDFAARFDPQSFHLDDEAAAANPIFGRLSASGWHTASATMRMMVDNLRDTGNGSLGSPGIDELRWIAPAYPGDTLKVKSEVIDKRASRSRDDIGFLKSRVTTLNQHDQPVMTMVATMIVPTA